MDILYETRYNLRRHRHLYHEEFLEEIRAVRPDENSRDDRNGKVIAGPYSDKLQRAVNNLVLLKIKSEFRSQVDPEGKN
jgi:hypothetical protein